MLSDGFLLIGKRDCPTCTLIEPVMRELAGADADFVVCTQDDPQFPEGIPGVIDDTQLGISYRLNIEVVPTLLQIRGGKEVGRVIGWHQGEWRHLTGQGTLGEGLPESRPGCGSKSVEPGMLETLALRFGDIELNSRRIEIAALEDEHEACFDRGWSDGLPVIPPTEARVARMLGGTTRSPSEVLGRMPPNLVECTVEKVAVNAVLAGCKPEYLPVVIACVEAVLTDEFCMHGLLATTWFSGPVVVVNGPITRAIGMNCEGNALGQGNRANGTIGRALQLVVRNVGGGRPREIDRAALGHPGKYTFCFAEDERDAWLPLAQERGVAEGASAVTVFTGDGVQGIGDQKSRTPESLARTFAMSLRNVYHPKSVQASDALLVVSPEHARVFHDADWSKQDLKKCLHDLLQIPGHELVLGANGISEGLPPSARDKTFAKFRDGGLNIVRAGGGAGMFSALIGGWPASGETGSIPVTKEIQL
ncbi:MAG: thioredoxin family protein [Gammaproteobacteria bacterium]|nr:thioredoxin family protein [Gammaproteobacteria bacterium]